MIVGTNNKIIIIKRVNFKEEAEDVEATTKQLIDQRQKMPHSLRTFLHVTHHQKRPLLMVCHVKEETQQNMWFLDTGCSNHMCGENEAFSDLDESFCSSVMLSLVTTPKILL